MFKVDFINIECSKLNSHIYRYDLFEALEIAENEIKKVNLINSAFLRLYNYTDNTFHLFNDIFTFCIVVRWVNNRKYEYLGKLITPDI